MECLSHNPENKVTIFYNSLIKSLMEDTQGIAPDFGIVRGKNLPYIPSYCFCFSFLSYGTLFHCVLTHEYLISAFVWTTECFFCKYIPVILFIAYTL